MSVWGDETAVAKEEEVASAHLLPLSYPLGGVEKRLDGDKITSEGYARHEADNLRERR